MAGAHPLPLTGNVFFDARGDGRALRLSGHRGAGVVVLSLWKAGVCTGTFRLPQADVQALVTALGRCERQDPAQQDACVLPPGGPAGAEEPGRPSGVSAPPGPSGEPVASVQCRPSGVLGPVASGPPAASWPEPGDRRVFPVTDEHEIPPPPPGAVY